MNIEESPQSPLGRLVRALPQTHEDMHAFALEHGIAEVKEILRAWVARGQPNDLMPGFTSRAICRSAAAGLDGLDVSFVPESYLDTESGPDLYWHMWTTEET